MSVFSRMSKSLKSGALILTTLVGLVGYSAQQAFAATYQLESSFGVLNVTSGQTRYASSTNATYDQVLQFEVYYHNREDPNSGRIANNLKVKVDLPTQAGQTQTVKSTVSADNYNTVVNTATVNLDRADAMLEFIPGSVNWKHNKGTNENVQIVTEKIADSIILNGTKLEDEKPCWNFEATVSFQMRVKIPSVSITKKVRPVGNGTAVQTMTAKAGDTVEYLITFKNMGNTNLTNVMVRDALPNGVTFVPGTVKLFNGPNPNGATINNDYLFKGGVNAGTFGAGATGYITFQAKIADADKLACGANNLKNIAVIDTDQTGEYNNNAIVNVQKDCGGTGQDYSYVCKALSVNYVNKAERIVTFTAASTYSAGVTVKQNKVDTGKATDDSDVIVFNGTTSQEVKYPTDKDSFTATLTVDFNVPGQGVKTAPATETCKVTVNFDKTPETPTELPNTGVGSIIGLFAATTVAGAVAHRLFARKLVR